MDEKELLKKAENLVKDKENLDMNELLGLSYSLFNELNNSSGSENKESDQVGSENKESKQKKGGKKKKKKSGGKNKKSKKEETIGNQTNALELAQPRKESSVTPTKAANASSGERARRDRALKLLTIASLFNGGNQSLSKLSSGMNMNLMDTISKTGVNVSNLNVSNLSPEQIKTFLNGAATFLSNNVQSQAKNNNNE